MKILRAYCANRNLVLMFVLVVFADIRRSNRPFLEDKTEDDFFKIDVRISG